MKERKFERIVTTTSIAERYGVKASKWQAETACDAVREMITNGNIPRQFQAANLVWNLATEEETYASGRDEGYCHPGSHDSAGALTYIAVGYAPPPAPTAEVPPIEHQQPQ